MMETTMEMPVAEAVGQPQEAQPAFAALRVDAARCTRCGACAQVCPTAALRTEERTFGSQRRFALVFTAENCSECGMCSAVCEGGCLAVEPGASHDAARAAYPFYIEIRSQEEAGAHLGSVARRALELRSARARMASRH